MESKVSGRHMASFLTPSKQRFFFTVELDRNCYHVIAMVVAAAEDLVLGFSFSCCHKLHKPLLNGCVMTYMYPTYIPFPTPAIIAPPPPKRSTVFILS